MRAVAVACKISRHARRFSASNQVRNLPISPYKPTELRCCVAMIPEMYQVLRFLAPQVPVLRATC
jgi:hypothetical protein